MEIQVLKWAWFPAAARKSRKGRCVDWPAVRCWMSAPVKPSPSACLCLSPAARKERAFATNYPTITVDGCDKMCAAKATEMLSGKPAKSLSIPEILKKHGLTPQPSCATRAGGRSRS